LNPSQHLLPASADVTFTPLDNTRSVVFELNGSLKVESVERNGVALTNVVQDQAGLETIGPFVRVDLGEVVPAGQQQTLRFRWSGALVTPEGGPLATKRLAYVGPELSYLMYAARWFPFHGYAADRATSDISITVPKTWTVAGHSSNHVTTTTGKDGRPTFTFVETQPVLPGSFAAGQFITRTINAGGLQIDVFV